MSYTDKTSTVLSHVNPPPAHCLDRDKDTFPVREKQILNKLTRNKGLFIKGEVGNAILNSKD